MRNFSFKPGSWALIAGAAEGLGSAFTAILAARKMNILMVDVNREAMQELAGKIRSEHKVNVEEIFCDLGSKEASDICLHAMAGRDCRLLVYVAAYSKVRPFLQNQADELNRYINVNARTPLHLIHGFAGQLKAEEKSGGILLVSSLAGLLGPPLVAPYAATKAFLIRLAESLSTEMAEVNIDIEVVCAGLTDTPTFQRNTPLRSQQKIRPMSPLTVAGYALQQLGRKTVCIPGWKNKLAYFFLLRILPGKIARGIFSWQMRKIF